jgi:aminoglycoside phosphotransferase (APT) family kinase protein
VPADFADLQATDAALLLSDVFPDRPAAEYIRRTGGELSTVYEARFATDRLIIKVYASALQWKQAKEAYVYQLLQDHLIQPIPQILHMGTADGRLGNLSYTVLTWLPGESLSAVSNGLDDSMAFSVYQQMGSFLARLHRIGQDAFGYVTTEIADPKPTNTEYMTAQFATKLREFRQLGGEPALAAAIDRHVAERTALFADCEHAVLCHNDFHEGNILVRRDDQGGWQVCGVVDVENAIAADPLTDLAKTDRYSIRGHRAKLDGLLAGYGPRGAAAAERMDLYGLYHALELWDWFASTHQTDRLTGLTSDMREMVR